MTDHPTTEDLSAHVDGREPGWTAHLDGCPQCRSRVESLRSVRAAVAVPPAPRDDADREDAIARAIASAAEATAEAAMAGGGGWQAVPSRSGEPPTGGGAPPLPLAPVVSLDEVRRRRRAVVMAVGSVAAVLVGLLVAVSVATRDGDGRRSDTAVAGPRLKAADGGAAGPPTTPAVRLGGDLGEISDTGALSARVANSSPEASRGAGSQAGPTSAATDTGAADSAAGENPPPALASPRPPAAAVSGSSTARIPPTAVEVGTRPCEIETRLVNQTLGLLLYYATAHWQGTPAVVLGFSPVPAAPGTPPVTSPLRLFVAAQGGCGLLAQATTP